MSLAGSPCGAYGFRVVGLAPGNWLGPCVPGAPPLVIKRQRWSPYQASDLPGQRNLLVLSPRCRLMNERASASMTIEADRMVADTDVLHPLLAYGAAMHAHWAGNLALHGGVVNIDDRAWVVLADVMGGKTSLLAAMAIRRFEILADDLAIVTPDRRVHAGPRCLDLRRSAAKALALQNPTVSVRRHRVRMALEGAPTSLPLGGFVALRWGDDVRIENMAPRERAELLIDARSAMGPASARTLLDLVAVQFFTLVRPRSFGEHSVSIDELVSAVRA